MIPRDEKMSTNIVPTANSPFLPLNHFGCPSHSTRLLVLGKRSLGSFSSERKIVGACAAPPRNWPDGSSAVKFNVSSSKEKDSPTKENLSVSREVEDDSDVLIECRNAYKSFGEKHILRGVSFKELTNLEMRRSVFNLRSWMPMILFAVLCDHQWRGRHEFDPNLYLLPDITG